MKITVSALSRFHMFQMVLQLEKHGFLNKIITGYPRFKLNKEWPQFVDCAVSLPWFGLYRQVVVELARTKIPRYPNHLKETLHRSFSETVGKRLRKSDEVLIGLSSYMLESIDQVQKFDIKTIVDHGSLHIKTERDVLFKECEKFGFKKFGNWQHKWMIDKMDLEFNNADYVFCCSDLAKQTLIENGVLENKIFSNPLGVDLNNFKYEKKIKKGKFKFLHVSNMGPLKGLHYIISAFNKLNLPNAELWLVGREPSEKIIQSMIRLNENIKFLGFMPERELSRFYNQCDVFLHPSLSDGWAMTVLQAMATGLPVIVSDKTGSKEIVRQNENGWVVLAGNVDELSNAMLNAYENRGLMMEMGNNANKSVKEGYTWDDYGDRLITWIETTL